MDVKGAYLNGTLKEHVYMHQPKGYQDGTNRICLLIKTLYGVRIARAVGSKTSTTTTPAHHPNANSFVSALHPHMLDPFPLVSLVPRAPSRLDLEAAQTLGLPKSTVDTTSAHHTEKATDRCCAHRMQPLASWALVKTPALF